MTNGNGNRLDYVGSVPVLPLSRNPFEKRMLFQLLAAFDAGPGDGLPLIRHLFVRKTQI